MTSGAAASAALLFMLSPATRAAIGTEASGGSATPTPIPVNAFLTLDVSAGDINTPITVSGAQFFPNEALTLYWDTPADVAGAATADGHGSFTAHVKPFAGSSLGVHHICASVAPNPCANFTLTATIPSPTAAPPPSPTAAPTPAPTAAATQGPSPTPIDASLNAVQIMTTPPFVFLPLLAALALVLAVGFWLLSIIRRPRALSVRSAAIVHRASRPDYSAGFGTPPPAAAPEPPSESAWSAFQPPPPSTTTPERPGSTAPDEPPEMPEPGED